MNNEEKHAMWMSARKTRNPILETMRDTFDGGDPWGSAVAWHFAVADVLTQLDPDAVPKAWEFRQSPFGPDTDSYEYEAIQEAMMDDTGNATIADLIHAGNVLARYTHLLELNGYSY